MRKLAATATPGTNVVVVTHRPNILDAFGKDLFDIRERESVVFKPDGWAAIESWCASRPTNGRSWRNRNRPQP